MENIHNLVCNTPICAGDPDRNFKTEVIWCPGEPVCKQVPHTKFQKKQIEINKLVELNKFRNIDRGYTANELEDNSI